MSDITQDAPAIAQNGHLWDSESGAEAARRSNAVQAATKALLAEAVEAGLPDDPYLRERCRRLRKQIMRLEDDLSCAPCAQDANYIAGALAKVSELERQLAGRPLPGTYRPQVDKSDKPSIAAAIRAARDTE